MVVVTMIQLIKMASHTEFLHDSSSHHGYHGLKPCLEEVEDSTAHAEEEFYNTPTPTSTPSEDIWKKFELFPTPPLSPNHDSDDSMPPLVSPIPVRLQKVSDCLLEEDSHWLTQPMNYSPITPTTRAPTPTSLKSNILIQDCMWSGLFAEEQRKKLCKKTVSSENKHSRSTSPPPLVPVSSDYNDYETDDCVDPASVFPYPLSETKLDIYSTGTCTPSDSDEEEIDVVTVADKKAIIIQPQNRIIVKTAQPTIQRHHLGRPRVITVVGSKRSRGTAAAVMTIPLKRLKTDANLEEVKRMLQSAIDKPRSYSSRGSSSKSSRCPSTNSSRASSRASSRPSSHPSSDSEDGDKRATHNVLERKRRDDLRCSFHALRDEVPDLSSKDRAAKVVILKTGTEFIHKLRTEEKRLLKEKENERRKHEVLLKRLHALQRM